MKKYLLTGLATILPIALTLMIGLWLFDLITAPLVGITEKIILKAEMKIGVSIEEHQTLALIISRTAAFLLLLISIFLLGFCGQKFLNNLFAKTVENLVTKIPFVRTIYRLSRDVTKALLSDTKNTFKETVLVPFPHQEVLSIGFVTGKTPPIFRAGNLPKTDIAVFVPTAPHPMSGFVLLFPRELALSVDVSVEDAFKFLISCGVIGPNEKLPSQTSDAPSIKK